MDQVLSVNFFNCLYQLLQYEGCLVLLQKHFLLHVVIQVSLVHQFSHYIQMCLRLKSINELNNTWVMTSFKNCAFMLNDIPLSCSQLELLNFLNCHRLVVRLVDSSVDDGEVASTNLRLKYIHFLNGCSEISRHVLFVEFEVSHPLFLD